MSKFRMIMKACVIAALGGVTGWALPAFGETNRRTSSSSNAI
jgi:hypothetical protein